MSLWVTVLLASAIAFGLKVAGLRRAAHVARRAPGSPG